MIELDVVSENEVISGLSVIYVVIFPDVASIGLSLDDRVVIEKAPVISVVLGFLKPPRTTSNGLLIFV